MNRDTTLLASLRDTQGLPQGANVRVLKPGTDIEANVYGQDGTVLAQPLIVGPTGVPGSVHGSVEIVATAPGFSRSRSLRSLRDTPRTELERPNGRRALQILRGATPPTEQAVPRGTRALQCLRDRGVRPPDPAPPHGTPALDKLRGQNRPQATAAPRGIRALKVLRGRAARPADIYVDQDLTKWRHLKRLAEPREHTEDPTKWRALVDLAQPRMRVGDEDSPVEIPNVEVLAGDGGVLLTIFARVDAIDDALDEDTGVIPIDALHAGIDDTGPYFSSGPAGALIAWDPQTQMIAILSEAA